MAGLSCATPTFVVHPGRTSRSSASPGVGKSTLLRSLAALDAVAAASDQRWRGVDCGISTRTSYETASPTSRANRASREASRSTSWRSVDRSHGTSSPISARLGLVADRTTRFEELSRGERARVAIARALVTSPADPPPRRTHRPVSAPTRLAASLALLAATGATVDRRDARPSGRRPGATSSSNFATATSSGQPLSRLHARRAVALTHHGVARHRRFEGRYVVGT